MEYVIHVDGAQLEQMKSSNIWGVAKCHRKVTSGRKVAGPWLILGICS